MWKLDRLVQTKSGLKAGNSVPGCFDQVWSFCIANQDSHVTVMGKSPETGVTTLDSERKVVVSVFRSACAWRSSVTLQRPPGSVSVITSGALSRSVNLMVPSSEGHFSAKCRFHCPPFFIASRCSIGRSTGQNNLWFLG